MPEPPRRAPAGPRTRPQRFTLVASVGAPASRCSAWQSRVPLADRGPAGRAGVDRCAGGSGSSGSASRRCRASTTSIPRSAYSRESWTLLDTVCARLMRYRDRPPPAGYQLVPDVAAAPPTVSADGTTYTFRLRKGFRFSDGSPVRADAFAQAIYRTHGARCRLPAYLYTQAIVGAADVKAGKSARAIRRQRPRPDAHRPLHARGRRLRRLDDDALLLRRPAHAAAQPRGRAHLPRRRPLLRPRLPPEPARRHPAQPLLRRRPRSTTSTASTSTSPPAHPRSCSTGSRPARRTGATRSRRSTSRPAAGFSAKYGLNRPVLARTRA